MRGVRVVEIINVEEIYLVVADNLSNRKSLQHISTVANSIVIELLTVLLTCMYENTSIIYIFFKLYFFDWHLN